MVTADFMIRNAKAIVPCAGRVPRRGPAQRDLSVIPNGSVASQDGAICFVGTADDCQRTVRLASAARALDATGCTVLPGFVDPHTHAVYAGARFDELRRRLAGASYAEIAAGGGGIVATVQATRAASADEVLAQTRPRLDEMLRCGTTTCEMKSGYGLDVETELKLLRVIRALDRVHPMDLVPTFMGAHEIPVDYRSRRRAYLDLIIDQMIPAVAAEGLAEWCDVFCDEGVYTPEEAREILDAGRRANLKPRLHADELAPSGGTRLAADLRARAADHLVHVAPDGIRALADAGVVATLLPVAAFYLKLGRYAPARALIDAGVPVALATDVNPGGGFSPSMPFAMALACFEMQMTLEEAVIAATINAAYALDRHDRVGSIEPAKRMDAVVIQGDLIELVRVGSNAIRWVIKNGRVVIERSETAH